MKYESFIKTKRKKLQLTGFKPKGELNANLFDWQSVVVDWAIRRGRSALFEECGLGKTIQQLAWAEQVVKHTNKPVMLHCPVGVRQQTAREAEKFGIDADVVVANDATDVVTGINLVNYEKLQHFDCSVFAGVVLDESSILKNAMGKTKKLLVESYRHTPYKLACTATPSPNDHIELGSHAEFLGICEREDMLSKYFVHDGSDTSKWRLRGHAVKHFWDWVATWAVCLSAPSDIKGSDDGFVLPALNVERHNVAVDQSSKVDGLLFNTAGLSATTIHEEKRLTCQSRCDKVAELVNHEDSFVVVWCDTNYEADALLERVSDCIEIRGNHTESQKEQKLNAFANGECQRLITKPSVAGFGMNWQHCNHQVFAGLSYSFEAYYQAVRRCWRFGQQRPVKVDIVIAESESALQSAVASKESDHRLMQTEMAEAMRSATHREVGIDKGKSDVRATDNYRSAIFFTRGINMQVIDQQMGNKWHLYHGDCCDVLKSMPDDSLDYSVFSPPFASLYVYSDSERDMGNSESDEQFFEHFGFLVEQLHKKIKPGRLVSVHCMNLPSTISHQGYIGIRDFRGDIIRSFVERDWIYHSEVCIWKDPVVAMQRTKALGLLHKQVKKGFLHESAGNT